MTIPSSLDPFRPIAYPAAMKPTRFVLLLTGFALLTATQPMIVSAETETIDLKALAKKARPAVMLLVVSDAAGKEIANGTGFLVSSDGKLITNFHVIEKAASAVAKSENGGLFPIEGVLASDPKNDLVLLKLKAKDLPFLTLGNSDKIEVGTRIAVIGSPLGLEGTLSEGIVSAVRESSDQACWIQITAAISPGSSGSPVLNAVGQVIGVATLVVRGGQSLNFAVTVEATRKLLTSNLALRAIRPYARSGKTDKDVVLSSREYKNILQAQAVKRPTDALKAAQALVRRFPENAYAVSVLASAYLNLGFWDEAVVASKEGIKLDPNDDESWEMLGLAYSKWGKSEEAIAAYHRAIEIKPNDAGRWMGLGIVLGERGSLRGAAAAYEHAVQIKPSFTEAWYNLGGIYFRSGQPSDAITDYRQAVRINPSFAEAWYGLAIVYRYLSRDNEATAAFAQARRLKPELFQK